MACCLFRAELKRSPAVRLLDRSVGNANCIERTPSDCSIDYTKQDPKPITRTQYAKGNFCATGRAYQIAIRTRSPPKRITRLFH